MSGDGNDGTDWLRAQLGDDAELDDDPREAKAPFEPQLPPRPTTHRDEGGPAGVAAASSTEFTFPWSITPADDAIRGIGGAAPDPVSGEDEFDVDAFELTPAILGERASEPVVPVRDTSLLTPPPADELPPANAAISTVRADQRHVRRRAGGMPTVLLWVGAVVLVAAVVLGAFVLGTYLPGWLAGAPAPAASTTPAAPPSSQPTGPATAGTYPWSELGGGECLEPYDSPWAENFTVVDCATPHAAQLVYRGQLPGDKAAPFPGEEAHRAQVSELCAAPGVIDQQAASTVGDVQYEASYPVTEEQWQQGQRHYYCFVSRASGEPLTGSVAGAGPQA